MSWLGQEAYWDTVPISIRWTAPSFNVESFTAFVTQRVLVVYRGGFEFYGYGWCQCSGKILWSVESGLRMFKKTASRSVAGTTSIKHDTRLKLDFLAPFQLNCRLLINACRTVGTWKVCRGAISNSWARPRREVNTRGIWKQLWVWPQGWSSSDGCAFKSSVLPLTSFSTDSPPAPPYVPTSGPSTCFQDRHADAHANMNAKVPLCTSFGHCRATFNIFKLFMKF